VPSAATSPSNTLATHIRDFEPLVVAALLLYQKGVSVYVQRDVLTLICMLVRCRVNYNLLDVDHKLIKFMVDG
jgi:hypothetical protein